MRNWEIFLWARTCKNTRNDFNQKQSPRSVFKNKTLPKNLVKFREKHFAWTWFKQSCRLKACNFMKKDLDACGVFLQFYNGFQYIIILSVLNCISRVPSCLTCFTCLTCRTCPRAIRACVSASYVPSFFTCHMYRHLLRALRALSFFMCLAYLYFFMCLHFCTCITCPHVFKCFTCFRIFTCLACLHFSLALQVFIFYMLIKLAQINEILSRFIKYFYSYKTRVISWVCTFFETENFD